MSPLLLSASTAQTGSTGYSTVSSSTTQFSTTLFSIPRLPSNLLTHSRHRSLCVIALDNFSMFYRINLYLITLQHFLFNLHYALRMLCSGKYTEYRALFTNLNIQLRLAIRWLGCACVPKPPVVTFSSYLNIACQLMNFQSLTTLNIVSTCRLALTAPLIAFIWNRSNASFCILLQLL